MKLRIRNNRMEEVEGLQNEYPYAFHHVDLAQTMIPWHWHEALEFDYVAEGRVQVSTPGQTQTFSAGEGFFLNSNVLTAMAREDHCVMDSHLFHSVFLAGHFKSVFETKYLSPVIHNRNLELLPIRGQTQTEREILEKLRQLARFQQAENMEFQTRSLLSEIWLLLLQVLESTRLKALPTKNQDRMLTMMAFIQEHYAEKLTLEEIAGAAAVSTRECLRCFRASIRQSPMEYLIDFRIQTACRLLEKTDLSITDIAMETGWGSSSYFSKIFRKFRGKTPNEYRKAYQNTQGKE